MIAASVQRFVDQAHLVAAHELADIHQDQHALAVAGLDRSQPRDVGRIDGAVALWRGLPYPWARARPRSSTG